MDKIYVVYWSQTGNTEVMAEAIGQGIRESGREAETLTVSQITADTLKEAQAFALGCPAMGKRRYSSVSEVDTAVRYLRMERKEPD